MKNSTIMQKQLNEIPLRTKILVNNGYKIVDECFGYQRYKNEEINVTIEFSGLWCYIVRGNKIHRLESVQDLLDIYKERNINAEIKLDLEI